MEITKAGLVVSSSSDNLAQGVVVAIPMDPVVVNVPAEDVVAFPPTQRLEDTDKFVVEAPPLKVESPATASEPVKLAADDIV